MPTVRSVPAPMMRSVVRPTIMQRWSIYTYPNRRNINPHPGRRIHIAPSEEGTDKDGNQNSIDFYFFVNAF